MRHFTSIEMSKVDQLVEISNTSASSSTMCGTLGRYWRSRQLRIMRAYQLHNRHMAILGLSLNPAIVIGIDVQMHRRPARRL